MAKESRADAVYGVGVLYLHRPRQHRGHEHVQRRYRQHAGHRRMDRGPRAGIGLALEFLSIHGMDYRLDGHALNVNPVSYNLVGLEPSVQYTIFHGESGALVAAAGCLFSVVGQNDINAVYPNMSIYYYWSKRAPQ